MAQQIQLRRGTAAQWSLANPILAEGELGVETDTDQFKVGDGVSVWASLGYGGLVGPAQTNSIQSFGDGNDGDVSLSSGTTTLTQDMFYNNLTLSGTAIIITAGYRIFVKGTLDLSNAQAGAIRWNGVSGGNGSVGTGGTAGTALASAALGGAAVGSVGGTGTTTTGGQAGAPGTGSGSNGGAGGLGGTGGTGNAGANAAGAARAGGSISAALEFARFTYDLLRGAALIVGGAGGAGGSAGGGDGASVGRGGGGGGSGGGIVAIWAKTITTSVSTPSGVITSLGGNGGLGASATGANVGGGGGGAGGGGGYILVFCENRSGPTVTNGLQATGGIAGNGGNGFGTGLGGSAGSGGNGGRIRLFRTLNNSSTSVVGSAGPAPISAPSGVTGGTASPNGGASSLNL